MTIFERYTCLSISLEDKVEIQGGNDDASRINFQAIQDDIVELIDKEDLTRASGMNVELGQRREPNT